MDKYTNAVEQLKYGIKDYVNKRLDDITCDKTYSALVVNKYNDNSYDIILNGVKYNKIKTIGGYCDVNEIVKVLVPQNNYNNMFILKSLDDDEIEKYYNYTNENDITISINEFTEVFSTSFLTNYNARIKIDMEFLLNSLSFDNTYTGFEVHYYVNNELIEDRIPKGRLYDGDNIVRLMYIISDNPNGNIDFRVEIKAINGTIQLNAKQELVDVNGTGLLNRVLWNGLIDIYEEVDYIIPLNPEIIPCIDVLDLNIIRKPIAKDLTWGEASAFNWQEMKDNFYWK